MPGEAESHEISRLRRSPAVADPADLPGSSRPGLSIGCASPPGPPAAPERVTIPSGASPRRGGRQPRQPTVLSAPAPGSSCSAQIRRGSIATCRPAPMRFRRDPVAWKVLTILASGRVVVVRFTVPEVTLAGAGGDGAGRAAHSRGIAVLVAASEIPLTSRRRRARADCGRLPPPRPSNSRSRSPRRS